jgi:hypothetical protein
LADHQILSVSASLRFASSQETRLAISQTGIAGIDGEASAYYVIHPLNMSEKEKNKPQKVENSESSENVPINSKNWRIDTEKTMP